MRDFNEDPKEEISGNQRFRARETSYLCFYASRGMDSSYLGLSSTFGLRKEVFRFRVCLGEGKMGFSSSNDFLHLGEGKNLP